MLRPTATLCAVLLLSACAVVNSDQRVSRAFSASGISQVVLRASGAPQATVESTGERTAEIVISGRPSGGAEGYHPTDSKWKETPASEWGLDFESQRFGHILVVSSKNEIEHIHHRYLLEELRLTLPEGVSLVLEERALGPIGAPDLSRPVLTIDTQP